MVESAKIEALDCENYSINSYNFQDESSIRIDPYTMFLHAMKSPVTKAKYSRRIISIFPTHHKNLFSYY